MILKRNKIKNIISNGLRMSLNDSLNGSNIVELVDVNNKKISVNLNDVSSIVEDTEEGLSTNIQDGEDPAVISCEVKIVDAEGNDFNVNDAIKDVQSNNGEIIAIDVTLESTHNGLNSNNYVYNSQDLEDAAHTWMTPFKKPLLKNHNMSSEPLGRIVDAYYGKSDIVVDKDTINTVFRVTDKEAMVKFLDKRYSTVSIGASAGNVRCNICGKDILKDGVFKFCGHWRGEQYNGQKATWTAGMFDYKECSIVNNPADKYAQVKKISVIKKDHGEHNNSEDNPSIGDSENDANNINDNSNDNLLDNIDNAVKDNTENVEDSSVTENDIKDSENEEPKNQDNISDEEEKAKLLKDLEERNKKIAALDVVVQCRDAEIEHYKEQITLIKDENENSKKKFATVSLMYRKSLIDHIVTKKLVNKAISEELVDEEKTSLLAKSTKELLALIDSTKLEESNTNTNTKPIINNPGLVDNNKGNVIEDETGEESESSIEDNNEKKLTLKDIEIRLFEN